MQQYMHSRYLDVHMCVFIVLKKYGSQRKLIFWEPIWIDILETCSFRYTNTCILKIQMCVGIRDVQGNEKKFWIGNLETYPF